MFSSTPLRYDALEVFPSASIPTFRQVGSISFDVPCIAVSFSDGLLVILSEANVIVWNAAESSWARWHTGIATDSVGTVMVILHLSTQLDYQQLYPVQCHKCDGNLVFMQNGVITVWEIPRLVDRKINPPVEIRYPLFSHIHRQSTEHHGSVLVSRMGWKPAVSSKTHPFHLDMLYAQRDGYSALDHHILNPIDNDASEGLQDSFPILIGNTLAITPAYEDTLFTKSVWMNSDESIYFWTEKSNVMVILSTLSPSKDFPSRHSVGVLWTSPSNVDPDPEVCPFSGRICILNRHAWLGSGPEIRVMDYLSPPAHIDLDTSD